MSVEINPQNDKSRTQIVSGKIKEILTRSDSHPHGILVLLESGDTGRVKAIVGSQSETSQTTNSKFTGQSSLAQLLKDGENHRVEFKERALWSVNYSNEDIKAHRPQSNELHKYGQATSKYIIAKTLAGFLNTEGGTLLIGALENKDGSIDTVGIDQELIFLKDQTVDGYRRMIVDVVKDFLPSETFNSFNQHFIISFDSVGENNLCRIEVSKADSSVFLTIQKNELFFIRVDASTRQITGSDIVDYCKKHYST